LDIVVDGETPIPKGLVYQAVAEDGGVIIAADEEACQAFFARVGWAEACRTMTRLFAEAQREPGIPVQLGPGGIERRSPDRPWTPRVVTDEELAEAS
jgi:hypothetical protein